jgi:hypothetical protein
VPGLPAIQIEKFMKKIFSVFAILIVFAILVGGAVDGINQVVLYAWNGTSVAPVNIDKATRAVTTIDYAHHEVHAGSEYFITYSATVASGNSMDILVITPDTTKWSHAPWEIESTLVTTFYIYEGTTVSNNGTDLSEINSNRNSASVAGTQTYHTPTVTGTGTQIYIEAFGISTGAFVRVGGESNSTQEIILKQNTKYLFRITSGTNGSLISFRLRWYEHTDKT